MMISCYNKAAVGDTLMIILANVPATETIVNKQENVAELRAEKTGEVCGYNIFNASELLPDLSGSGQIFLTADQVAVINQKLQELQFAQLLTVDNTPKFVVGYVKTCEDHPDSDHLHITQTEVDNGETLQIVCGAANIAAGQKVIVAKVGAMMPNGLIIWPGELRGVESNGMICSRKELGLPQEEKGIWVLPADAEVGSSYTLEK